MTRERIQGALSKQSEAALVDVVMILTRAVRQGYQRHDGH